MNKSILSFISQWECINAAYRSSMEDKCVIYPALHNNKNIAFIALMDGHGGCATASYVATQIGDNLYKALHESDFTSFEEVLRYTFLLTDVQCRTENLMASGCTCASVLIVRNEKTNEYTLYSANIGDSRVVIYSNGAATRLSYDHKAEDKQEIARIVDAGGAIINKRVMGLLAVTRSFGDLSIKDFVIAEPYLRSVKLTKECQFVIIGCDGVFDVLSDDEACHIVNQCIREGNTQNCAKCLVEEALRRDSRDNITAIVIGL